MLYNLYIKFKKEGKEMRRKKITILLLAAMMVMVASAFSAFASSDDGEHQHSWETETVKGSFSYDGYIRVWCPECETIQSEEFIPQLIDDYDTLVTYTGEVILPKIRLKDGNTFQLLSKEYYEVVPLTDCTNAGMQQFKIVLKGDYYEGEQTYSYKILPAGMSGIESATTTYYEYDGKAHTIEPLKGVPEGATVYYKVAGEDTEFSSELPYRTDAGEYMIDYVVKKENYYDYGGYTWLYISPYQGELKFKYSYTKTPYNGKVQAPVLTVTDGNGNKFKVKTTEISNGKGIQPGRYNAYYDLGDNYAYAPMKTYYIVPKKSTSFTAQLRDVSAGYKSVKLTWKKCKGADGYTIYYKKASETTYRKDLIFGSEDTSLKISARFLRAGTKYTFKLVPYVKADGKNRYLESQTSTVSITTLKKVAKPTVKRTTSKKVKITWTNIAGETGYQISRSKTKNGTKVYKTYKTTTGKKISKTITVKKTNTTYYYRVRAYKTIKVGDTYKKVYAPWSEPVKCK